MLFSETVLHVVKVLHTLEMPNFVKERSYRLFELTFVKGEPIGFLAIFYRYCTKRQMLGYLFIKVGNTPPSFSQHLKQFFVVEA